ncbi:MAG: class I SAM-dependent rRNA methyltransferase [Bacteroidia bacterium]|jgi:23S rRNA (cytosine1962-C5)-methyltransferase
MQAYKKLVLKSGRERSLVNRHPWVFSGAVKELPEAENGEIIQVTTNHGELLGYGFFAPGSQITCRVFEFTAAEIAINCQFWIDKMLRAYALRQLFIQPEQTNIFRLLHAEGDFFPGVIVDVYADVAVVQLLIRGTERIKETIVKGLNECGIPYVYLKTKSSSQLLEAVEASGWVGERKEMPVIAKENGIRFRIDVETGQKTGFFIDQRVNRETLGAFARGKRVLNTFSYSGGFSMYALEQGATLVHSVDSSKEAIALCNQQVTENGYDAGKHEGFAEDVFEFMRKSETDYDIIVLDPPAFAKNAKAVPNATRGYKNLNLVAFKKIKPGGLIFTFSCSQHIDKDLFRKIVFGAAADAGRNVRILRQLTQPEDHPINIYHPEGEYLKGLLLHVE